MQKKPEIFFRNEISIDLDLHPDVLLVWIATPHRDNDSQTSQRNLQGLLQQITWDTPYITLLKHANYPPASWKINCWQFSYLFQSITGSETLPLRDDLFNLPPNFPVFSQQIQKHRVKPIFSHGKTWFSHVFPMILRRKRQSPVACDTLPFGSAGSIAFGLLLWTHLYSICIFVCTHIMIPIYMCVYI